MQLAARTQMSARVTGARAGQKSMAARPAKALRSSRRVVRVRAEATVDDPSAKTQEAINKAVDFAKEKWEATEDKPAAILVASSALIALYLANSVVSTVDRIPVLNSLLELVGLFVSAYYGYKYITSPSEREGLMSSVKDFASKIGYKG